MVERDPGWVRVGQRIAQRMAELNLGITDVEDLGGPTDKTLRSWLAGGRPQTKGQSKLCDVLQWDRTSLQRIYEGQEPIEARTPSPDALALLRARVDDLEERLARLEAGQERAGDVVPFRPRPPPTPQKPPPTATPVKKAAKKGAPRSKPQPRN